MEFDANKYNNTNALQIRDAKEMIDRIVEENRDKKYDIILDIGCGSGNVTIILDSVLNAHQIYAIDVDHHMIEFAKQNHSKDKIRYFAQDFGLEWDQLTPELRSIEGKVSLIFSNHCLHWIKNKENVVKNLYRLLSKSGQIYTQFICFPDPFAHLAKWIQVFTPILNQIIKIPTIEVQRNLWINAFNSVDLELSESKVLDKIFNWVELDFKKHFMPLAASFYALYIPVLTPKILQILTRIMRINGSKKYPKFVDETTGLTMCAMNYQNFLFVLQKNN